jgi:chemotaxis signal transduction protein
VTAVVAFRFGGQDWAVAVERVRRVLRAAWLVPLPDPKPGVAGLLHDEAGTVTVLSPLGATRGQVLVLDYKGAAVGLLVDEVIGVERVDDPQTGPPPAGQRSPLVAGVLTPGPQADRGGRPPEAGFLLLLDVGVLAGRLSE